MSDSLRSYPEHQREAVVRRRLRDQSGGLGYWAAVDAEPHIDKAKRKEQANVGRTEDS